MVDVKMLKRGTKVTIVESDGRSTTDAKVVRLDTEDGFEVAMYAYVKLLEPRWLLSENVMLARKGSVVCVPIRMLKV